MKTKQIISAILLSGTIFTAIGQVNIATTTLTSRGLQSGTLGTNNAFFGYRSGYINTAAGVNNTFFGHGSGSSNTIGSNNTYIGNTAGGTTGNENVCIGKLSGGRMFGGNRNTYVGTGTAFENEFGNYNTFLGYGAGGESLGANNNIFIGCNAGYFENGDNKLYIDSYLTPGLTPPLIWGDFELDQIKLNGKVGIGGVDTFPTTAAGIDVSNYQLFVNGGILAKEVRVATTWADYVFEDNYQLKPLAEVECFIEENGHLPNVPSAKQVEEEGIEVGNIAKIQQEKIEELTLYLIEQNKKIEKQESELKELKELVHNLIDKK